MMLFCDPEKQCSDLKYGVVVRAVSNKVKA